MLDLKPDRLLAPFCEDAGIKPKEPKYPNWESTGLGGQTGGHYLSALALMYQSTGNPELLRRLNYMISVLSECQTKNGNGYVGGVPNSKQMWIDLSQGVFSPENGRGRLNNHWVPWYNIHKTFAGLRDAYLLGGNKQAKEVLIKLAEWCYSSFSGLSVDQFEKMLEIEHGGMNEVLADVYQITGDKKFLTLAQQFSHKAILNPLLNQEDKLNGLHANTQIPKVIGFEFIAELSNDTAWHHAAEFFWNNVVSKRTVAFGGNSVKEHFHNPDDYSSMLNTALSGPETCNTYNMLRLSKMLYANSNSLKYIDFYERGLFNHILSSQHPDHGGFVYLTTIHPQQYRTYSQSQQNFWCCVGTGIENHAKYGELIYSHTTNDLFVNLFIASELNWKEKGLKLIQSTSFPESETTSLKLQLEKPATFTLNIRYPSWVKAGDLSITINGKPAKIDNSPATYIALNKNWTNEDVIIVKLPMQTTAEYLPDHSPWIAFLHGPIVLAAKTDSTDLANLNGEDGSNQANGKIIPFANSPLLVSTNIDYASQLKPVSNKKLTYTAKDLLYPNKFKNIELIPFYKIHDSRYIIYWQVTTPADLQKTIQLNIKRDSQINQENLIDEVSPGEQQSEIDHNVQSENSITGTFNDSKYRQSKEWFSYDFKDNKKAAFQFQVKYSGKDTGSEFEVLINGFLVATKKLSGTLNDDFITIDYRIPKEIRESSNGLYTLKFKAKQNNITASVFNIKLLKLGR